MFDFRTLKERNNTLAVLLFVFTKIVGNNQIMIQKVIIIITKPPTNLDF